MINDPYGWFPSPLFNNLFFLIFIGVYAVDYIVPRFTNPNYQRKSLRSDSGSYLVIALTIFLEISLRERFEIQVLQDNNLNMR